MKTWLAGTAIAVLVVVPIAGCGAAGEQSDTTPSSTPSIAPTASDPPSASASLDPELTMTYSLGSETVVRISRDGAVLRADRGRVTVSGATSSQISVAVVATDQAGSPTWSLAFDVTPQNRVGAGALVEGGTTWSVLAQTGLVTSTITDQLVDLQTDRAVTMTSSPTGTNTPVTFRVVGRNS